MATLSDSYQALLHKIVLYKRKYYRSRLLRGTIFTAAVVLSVFIAVNSLEYLGNFGPAARALLFYGFAVAVAGSIFYWMVGPVLNLLELRKPLDNEEAARQIGLFFPEIGDKLLNVIQLGELDPSQSDLLQAGIDRKAEKLQPVDFGKAVNFSKNRRYAKYALIPFLFLLGVLMLEPTVFTHSMPRIINYSETYVPEAPFAFEIENTDFKVFKNEDFRIDLRMTGKAIPDKVFLLNADNRRIVPEKTGPGTYSYTFKKVQKDFSFAFEAAGFSSVRNDVKVYERPGLGNFNVFLHYPAYTGKTDEKLNNTGNLIVPAGTQVRWQFRTRKTEQFSLKFAETGTEEAVSKNDAFELSKRVLKSENYSLHLKNEYSDNKDPIEYYLNVIPDRFPEINLKQFEDTTMYNYLLVGGNISDDYGIGKLQFKYRVLSENEKGGSDKKFTAVGLPFTPTPGNQSFYHQMNLADLNLKQGDRLEYFAEVWDNDGVQGSKSVKTTAYTFRLPSEEEFNEEVEKTVSKTEKDIDKTLQKARKLKKDLKKMQDRIKSKKSLSWQEQKLMESLVRQKQDLNKEVEEMRRQNKMLSGKQERFGERNERIAEKAKELQKLMDNLLDEETRKMYDELNEMLDQQMNADEIRKMLEDIEKKEQNLENELDRSLEMFKRLQVEQKLNRVNKELNEQAEEQEKLAEETEKQAGKEDEKDAGKKEDAKDGKKETKPDSEKDGKKEDGKKKDGEEDAENSEENQDGKKDDSQAGEEQEQKDSEKSDLEKKQDELSKKFEKTAEDLKKALEQNKELEKPEETPEDSEEKSEEIKEDQKKSSEDLKQNKKKEAAKKQKQAAKKMKKMAEKMSTEAAEGEMKQMQEDYNALRMILENLVKVSFDQEDLMKNFRGMRPEDPRLVPLGQQQLKIRDDAKIIEDSLMSLAKRVFQIKSFVTREVTAMNDYSDQAMTEIRKRNLGLASAKQQLVMTSMNNLALMLDDVMHRMQENIGKGKGGMQIINKKRKEKKPGDLSDLQKQLGKKISDLKGSGKSGRALSEELAKLAAQQEMIRKAVQKMMQGMPKDGNGGKVAEMLEQMEKTEEDLVNKRITRETINRQKSIETRLLESEKAMREREQDEERQAEQAKDKQRKVPDAFSDYLRLKEKQADLLKTVPPSLNPYFKKEVNEYFKKLER